MYNIEPIEKAEKKGKKIKFGHHEGHVPEGLCSY